MKRVCVFCGSSFGKKNAYREAAQRMGQQIAQQGLGLVYGGGNVGLMGEVANACLNAGGEVIGVIPEKLATKEIAHWELTELKVVKTMHERKSMMSDLSDALIAMPGGVGTLEEIIETFTWLQLGFQLKPCGLLDTLGYYGQLQGFLDHMVEEGFLKLQHRDMMLVDADESALLEKLKNYRHRIEGKWIDQDVTAASLAVKTAEDI